MPPRGRPRKNPLPVAPPPAVLISNPNDPFRCSACVFTTVKYAQMDKHILTEHYGVARVNDVSNTPFTESERVNCYIRAQKVLKVLKCPTCQKGLRSGLGYKCHLDICGKDEEETMKECEICGKRLKMYSLPIHVKQIHMEPDKRMSNGAAGLLGSPLLFPEQKNTKSPLIPAGRKRTSAIRALEQFKELLDDDEINGTNGMPSTSETPAKKRKRKADDDEDVEFKMAAEDLAAAEEEEAEADAENEDVEEVEEIQEGDEEEEEEAVEQDIALSISCKDLDGILLLLRPHIKRCDAREDPNRTRTLEVDLEALPADSTGATPEEPFPYKCYNEKCQKRFDYRIDLENHYKKCSNLRFLFTCVAEDDCPFKTKFINIQTFQHFNLKHPNILPDDNKVAQLMFRQMAHSRARTRNKPRPDQQGSWEGCTTEQDGERYYNYTKEWIKFIRQNGSLSTFSCLRPMRSHWKVLPSSSPSSVLSDLNPSQVPQFKNTKSMENGDNDFKFVPLLQSTRGPDSSSFTFNVGQFVCSSAWAPMPLPPKREPTDPDTSVTQSYETTPHQYLAIATTSFDESILNHTNTQNSPNNNSLQLWDMGQLESKQFKKDPEPLYDNLEPPKLALKITHEWGDIQEMSWGPVGSTYEDPQSTHKNPRSQVLPRLGLLALACEDGRIRILSVPHPSFLPESYDPNVCFNVTPVLVLHSRFKSITCSVNTLAWSLNWPQDSLLGGLNNGQICWWRLTDLAKCFNNTKGCIEHQGTMSLRPYKIFDTPRCCPVLSIKWMNPLMFFASSTDSCRIWHLNHNGFYGEVARNIIQKIENHPLWYSTVIMFDLSLNRSNNLIVMKSFGCDEMTTVPTNSESTRVHSIANLQKMRINDMSMSPWMYIVAYCTENGEMYTSQLLPKPYRFPKKLNTFLLYNIRLGDLIHFDASSAPSPSSSATELDDTQDDPPPNKKASRKRGARSIVPPLAPPPPPSPLLKSTNRVNQLVTDVIDLQHNHQDFYEKYFLIFDDSKRYHLNRMGINTGKPNEYTPALSGYLTKNDLRRFYAITNCSWNPNLSAYSWLFSATKSGLCRLNSFPLVNPHTNLNS